MADKCGQGKPGTYVGTQFIPYCQRDAGHFGDHAANVEFPPWLNGSRRTTIIGYQWRPNIELVGPEIEFTR